MKGYLTLGAPRSGSSWLASLLNSTGVTGNSREWLQSSHWSGHVESAEEHFRLTIAKASTPNQRFGARVFPAPLYKVYFRFGYDFIRNCHKFYETALVVLVRKDTVGQAISWSRAYQSKKFHSTESKIREETYNFEDIAKRYVLIQRLNGFWRSYLGIQQLQYREFTYEDLAIDPTPYVSYISEALQVEIPADVSSHLEVQRDERTEEWRERFLLDARDSDIIAFADGREIPARTIGNLARFVRKQTTKPYPFNELP